MSGLTVFVCRKCGKELSAGERNYCEKTDTRQCAECNYMEALGVRTVAEYHAWLRKGRTQEAAQ